MTTMTTAGGTTNATATTITGFAWNGPICQRCDARWLGRHTCSIEDIQRRIHSLQAEIDRLRQPQDGTALCPCRPENGGSGVCGCILGGPQITC